MEPYKGYFIAGTAKMVDPFKPSWYPAGSVLKSGRHGSLVEITRLSLPSFKLEMKELAEWIGLAIGRIVVDVCLA